MNDETRQPMEEQEENQYEAYGWEFQKKPLLYAAIACVLFYAFVFFYVKV